MEPKQSRLAPIRRCMTHCEPMVRISDIKRGSFFGPRLLLGNAFV